MDASWIELQISLRHAVHGDKFVQACHPVYAAMLEVEKAIGFGLKPTSLLDLYMPGAISYGIENAGYTEEEDPVIRLAITEMLADHPNEYVCQWIKKYLRERR